ncbi:hypothetical protein CR51_11940 [Caballeronia megalochromosomata]|nr:hypothetical protein CR51_11940 [Caballeronia megalochromosomata]
MSLPDRALQSLDYMVQHGIGERPLLLICHSLGGLVAKQILRKASDATDPRKRQVARQTRAVLFLATPHAGAELASLVNAFRTLFGASVSIEDLRAHDAHLRDLFEWYRNHAPLLRIQTATYFETRGVKGVLPIVNPTSAHPGIGHDPVGLDEDHLSIAKPPKRDAQVCRAARDLLFTHVLASPPAVEKVMASVSDFAHAPPYELVLKFDPGLLASGRPSLIPRELPPTAFKFIGRRAERKQLVERLHEGLNTAVVGPAGLGKSALAADALADVVGADAVNLASSPFPDGVVYLDLYALHGQADSTWNALANRLRGAEFMERRPARERATEACRALRMLVIVEGGEEADGNLGRATISQLFSVLSPENRWLLLSRVNTQSAMAETVNIKEALHQHDAAELLDWLTRNRPLSVEIRQAVLRLLEGHPLALNWAGNVLARDDEDPLSLVRDWASGGLPRLSDPRQAEHTLQWLFSRSLRGSDDTVRRALAAAGLLAPAPFSLEAIVAALGGADSTDGKRANEALKGLTQRGLLRRVEMDHWQFAHVLGYRFARDENGSDVALRQRLGGWLHGRLVEALQSVADVEAANSLSDPLQHAAALLRADPDRQLWDPLGINLLYDVSDHLERIGRLDLVSHTLQAVSEWLGRLPPIMTDQPYWVHQHSILIIDQGDVLRDQGDLAGALAAYRKSLALSERLAAVDPSNAGWQRDLSVSQHKLGDVLRDQGDLTGALAAYRESLALRKRLAAADPSNADLQGDLSVSHNNVGDVLRDQGDSSGALAAYRESMALTERLAVADPSNAGWQRDLSVSQNKVGDVLRDQGDLAGALAAYRESLALRKRLAAADPSNAGWQRDLNVSQDKMGDVLRDQGDLAGALAAYHESLALSERLAAADPSNAGWQRDLSVSQDKVGDVLRDQGDLAGALVVFRESLALRKRLAAADPSNARWQRDLSLSQDNVGYVLRHRGDLAGALAAYRESLALSERLAAADPSNAGWQRDLSVSHNNVGEVLRDQGDLTGALAAHRDSLALIERLAAADPSNSGWKRNLSASQNKVGEVLRDQGDLAGALVAYRESLALRKRLAAADPSNARWQRDLSYTLTLLAEVYERQGKRVESLQFAQESLTIDERLAALDPSNVIWQKDVVVSRNFVARLRQL